MRKKGFHEKQGYGGHYYTKCGKGSPYSTDLCVLTALESDGTWGVPNQRLPNIIYIVKFPFTEIFCSTCEWALRGNMCKHQIVVIFTCTDIHYCGTCYGSHRGGLGHMFVDPPYVPDDMESNDDDEDEHFEGDDGIMEFDVLMNMEQNDLPMGAIVMYHIIIYNPMFSLV